MSVVSVMHVRRSGSERQRIQAMRDGVYYRTDETIGFLGLTSRSKQYKGIMAADFSLERARSIVEGKEFQKLFGDRSDQEPKAWYVHVQSGQLKKCVVLSEAEANRNPVFISLIDWVRGLQASSANHERFIGEWRNEGTDGVLDNWCEGYE